MKHPHELDNLQGIKNYKGVLITREGLGYRVLGEYVETPYGVGEVLNNARKELGNSIVVDTRNGGFKFMNDEK